MRVHVLHVELSSGENATSAYTSEAAAKAELVAFIRRRWISDSWSDPTETMPEDDDDLIHEYNDANANGADDQFYIVECELDVPFGLDADQ